MHFGAAANRRQSLVLASQRCASGCKAQILHYDISKAQAAALTPFFPYFHTFDTLPLWPCPLSYCLSHLDQALALDLAVPGATKVCIHCWQHLGRSLNADGTDI